jgi:hypothetical protein
MGSEGDQGMAMAGRSWKTPKLLWKTGKSLSQISDLL